jgi:hypothetical protein
MEQLALIADLRKGKEPRAAELIAAGPPFDLASSPIVRHSVYLSASEVVFVFEGHDVEWMLDDLVDDPFHPQIHDALERWREIIDGSPRVARARFGWERAGAEPAAAEAKVGGTRWA